MCWDKQHPGQLYIQICLKRYIYKMVAIESTDEYKSAFFFNHHAVTETFGITHSHVFACSRIVDWFVIYIRSIASFGGGNGSVPNDSSVREVGLGIWVLVA